MVVFVGALKAMHVVVLRGEHFFNIPLGGINSVSFKAPAAFKIVANKRGLFNIIWLGEQRKASHAKNKH